VKRVFLEGIIVAVLGAAIAFAGNALSPRGLKLSTDYFPGAAQPSAHVSIVATSDGSAVPSATDLLAARLSAKGLQLGSSNQVAELFRDPRRSQDGVVFIDARDDHHYQAGHIPGAYQFDHYHPENYLATIMPLCQAAQQVVVYCNGGECEDSEFAATMLRDLGVSKEKLIVYGGGIKEWARSGQKTEAGDRNSGRFVEAAPE
jgi:rhodanese-related sulfurtransferase